MRSIYRPIGNYIRKVEHRNRDLNVTRLLGLSMTKEFRETTSNIVGTDMSVYRIMNKYQFACDFMSPIRVNKLPIVLKLDDEPNLVSPAYPVFEIKDRNELDPEYLMMWFRRPEFDRYATFKCDAAIRGGYEWKELCETLVPIPPISKQREIVQEYNTIQNRIHLNQQLIQKLEETAQAIYREWFVEGIDLQNLPEGWDMGILEDLVEFKNGKSKPDESGIYPVYGGNGIIEFVNEFNNENVIAIGRVGAYCGSLYRELGKCWISDNAISAKSKISCNMFTFYLLKDLSLNEKSEGTGQPLITQGLLNNIAVPKPKPELIEEFETFAKKLFRHEDIIEKENLKLSEMKELLLSRLATVS